MFDQTPNAFAFVVLALWPLAVWALVRRLGPARGLIAGLLAGYLLLPPPPAGFDFPLLPPLDKDTIPSLAALAACLALHRPGLRLLPGHPLARALLALYFAVPFLTVLTNPDPLFWGPFGLPGLRLREAVGTGMGQAIAIAPFLLARSFLAGEGDQRDLLWAVLWGGLAYSAPMLLEVRLSPQVNIWVYGFFQHLFEQMMRGDGYRPIVFLYHGLWAAFLAMTAVVAACALARQAEGRRAMTLGLAALWMLGTLVLCKSLASLVYALALAPLVLLAGTRAQLGTAALIAALACAYPLAKAADLVPREAALALAEGIDAERANSLRFRFDNEDALLAHANERPVFGWGLWGRNLIYDPDTGRQSAIPDGRWIVTLGVFGWAGLLAEMGLLALPVWLAWARGAAASRATAAVALILAVNIADLMPNATATPLTWLFAGALLGWAERRAEANRAAGPLAAFRTIL